MLRALALFVGLLLAAGLYVLVTGGAASDTHAAAPEAPGQQQFGYALAAGAIALAATMMASRPRMRFRR